MNTSTTKQGFSAAALAHAMRQGSFCLFGLLCALPAVAQPLAVSEFQLENGVKVLLAPRHGSGAVHAAWFIEGGRCDTGQLPPEAADLLLESWLAHPNIAPAPGLWARAGSDGIGCGRDIAAEELEAWCSAELERIVQNFQQGQLDSAVESLKAQWENPDPMPEMFAIALKGGSYAMSWRKDIKSLSALSISDLSALAQKFAVAGRITIILVGGVGESRARAALGANFGQLAPFGSPPAKTIGIPLFNISDDVSDPAPQDGRRMEIPSKAGTEVLVAWQATLSQGGRPTLDLFAEILAGAPSSRLTKLLVAELGCSDDVQIHVSVPGGRAANLFVVQADVADGHSAHEVEQAILEEVRRTVEDDLRFAEINRAVHRMDAKHARRLADASGLAQALAHAIGSSGDWGQAIKKASQGAHFEPEALASFLKAVFMDGSSYSILAEQDPIRSPRGPEHARLISILFRLLEKNGIDAAKREEKVKESLRQFGLMSREMRGQLLALLEAEVGR